MSSLQIDNVSHEFNNVPVVQGLSIYVGASEVVCLLGPSGCGKTTLLRVAAGLENLQCWQISIGERVVADADTGLNVPPEKRGIGMMFQDYALFPHLTVLNNIHFSAETRNAQHRAWVENELIQMDLNHFKHRFPHTLSGGQQQRVALLRALAAKPKVLLLDEPFSGLDTTRRAQVRNQTLRILKDTGVSALIVTHDPEEALFMADRILVMNNGRIIQNGTPLEIYFEPSESFVVSLFGPINQLTGVVSDSSIITPFGNFGVQKIPDGEAVEILIRPEAISLVSKETQPGARIFDATQKFTPMLTVGESSEPDTFEVIASRPLGANSLISFIAPTLKKTVVFEARVPGIFLPNPGTKVNAYVDPKKVHIFKLR